MSLPKAVRHTFIQLSGRLFATLFGVIALAVVTRYLGQEKYGWYTTVSTFLQFFGILADFGLTLITAQMIAEPGADENKIISNIFTLRFWLSILFFGAAIIFVWFFPYPLIIKIGVAVFSLSLLAVTLQNIFVGLFQKHLAMSAVAWGDMLGRAVILIGYLICVWQSLNLLWILFISVIANVFQLALLWERSRKYIKIYFAYDRAIFKEIFRRSWPVAASIAFNLIYLRADILVLSLVRPQAEVGLYGAAYRIIDVLTSIPTMFMGLILPLLAFYWVSKDLAQFKKYFLRAFDFLSILGWPLLLGGVVLAKPLMILVAGDDFISSGVYLRILLLALFFIFFGLLTSHSVLALQKQKQMILWYLADAIISLVGYIIFIPHYGAVAAAWITVFSEGMIMVISYVVILKTTKIIPSPIVFLKSLVSALAMVALILAMPGFNFFVIMLSAFIFYFVILYLLRGITKEMILALFKNA